MPTKNTTDQPMLARTLRERWYNLLHRAPVSFIAHWDHLKPPSLTPYNVELAWTEIEGQIRRLPVDEAHGDVIDRLVEAYHQQFVARAGEEHLEREELAVRILNQGREHFIQAQGQVRGLRVEAARHRQQYAAAWCELTGSELPEPQDKAPLAVEPLPLPNWQPEPDPALTEPESIVDNHVEGPLVWVQERADSEGLNGFGGRTTSLA